MKQPQKFGVALLHPRYWLTWLGLGVLYLLVQLPYPVLHGLGKWMGRTSMHFLSRRVAITRRNLTLCFPEMREAVLARKVVLNFESLGLGLMETGMAWFWSDKRIRRWFTVSGLEHIEDAQKNGRGVLAIGIHFMSVELGGRAMGLCQPMMAIYRRHNNKAMEWAQTKGRMRSNKAMLDRKDLRAIVKTLKGGEAVWFAPDQDYGRRGSVFAPLFAVEQAATTSGTFKLVRMADPALIPTVLIRHENGHGYQLIIQPVLKDYPASNEIAAAAYMNKVVEQQIMLAPEQYMWLHRRFKTRPQGAPSLY